MMLLLMFQSTSAPIPDTSNKLGDWEAEYAIFSTGSVSNGGRDRNKIWHKGSLGDEDDVRTSNTRIVQRKRAIAQSTMKNKTAHI